MTKFSDQLFTDLMREHSATLQATKLPTTARGHWAVNRAAALAGGGGALAVGITAALAATSGGGAAAYAVTPHADGTVTVGISQPSGIPGANSSLSALGDRVVVVPVKAGCESMDALPAPAIPRGKIRITVSGRVGSSNGSITVDGHGVPPGDVLVIAADDTGHGTVTAARLTVAPAPSCVSLSAWATAPVGPPAGARSGSINISGSSTAPPGAKGAPERGSRPVTSGSGPGTSTHAG